MNQSKSVFLTLIIGLIVLAGLDIVFNQGQTIAALIPDRTAVSVPSLDNQNLLNNVPNPGGIVIDTSAPATVIHSNPLVVTATPQATPTDEPEVIFVEPEATTQPGPAIVAPQYATTPTAISPYAPPEGGYTTQFLQDCAAALQGNRRANPRCPANSAEMLAGGGR